MKKFKLFSFILVLSILGSLPAFGDTYTINFGDSFNPALPTASGSVNSTATAHTVNGLSIKEAGIYKGSSADYIMFAQNKGYLYNTTSLGTITKVAVTYSSGCSTTAKAGVYFGSSALTTYTTTTNATIKGQSKTDEWTNSTSNNGFFQLSTSNKNCQVTKIEITYTPSGGSTPTLSSITISGTPNKTTYEAGENFDPIGLVATGTYSDASSANITSSVTWAYTPAGALTENLTSVNVTATSGTIVGNKDIDITVTPALPKSTLIFTKACGGSGTANDGAVWTVTSDASESAFDNTKGIHYGTGSAAVSNIRLSTSAIKGTIKKVVVNASGASGTGGQVSVAVGGTAFNIFDDQTTTAPLTTSATDYTFTGSATGTILVAISQTSTKKALYCKSIVVSYEAPEPAAVADPTFSVAAGTYLGAQSVELECATTGADIYYTLDGSDPDNGSTLYNGTAIAISSTTTIKAIAIKGSDESDIASATYTIINLDHAGTAEDPYSVADAKIVIDVLGTKENAYVSGIVSSIYSTSLGEGGFITFYISADGATTGQQLEAYKCKSLNGEAFSALTDVVTGANVVITGTLKKYNSTYEFDQNCHLVSYVAPVTPKQHIANDQANPYTVAQALVYAADGVTYDLDDYVYVRGVVYDVKSFSNGAMNIFIKDADAENQFELYKCAGINDGNTTTPFEALTDVQSGDIVIGYGQLTVFNNVSEFKQGNYLVDLDRPVVPVTGVTIESTASVAVGGSITLNASVVPSNASNKTINWSIQSGNSYVTLADGVVTGVAEGTAVIRATSDADATKYAECTVTVAPLSPWATVYTSNLADITGAKVKFYGESEEYNAIKAGTGSVAGEATINVPAQATALHLHAYGWKGETVTLSITAPAGVTVTPSSIEINSNTGITSNSPFTLAEGSTPQTDAYYALSLSGNTDAIELTITATAGKRFVLFGVNQEGGILPVLDHIVVTGDANDKTYDAGDRFDKYDYDGLGASAIYTLSGVEQAPVAIPFADIEWSSDPEIVGASTASVAVTATYEGKSATREITGLTVNIPDPEIEVSATSLAFGKVAKGATVADKELTVTLRSVENATLTISGDGASAFSLDKYALTATGTVTVSASSATVGTFDATLTISDNAGKATAQEVALSITVEAADDLSGTWNLVTSEDDLLPGVQVIVAQYVSEGTAIKTMGQQNSNNRAAVESSVSGIELAPAAGTKVLTLVDAGDGMFALQASNGKYLYAAGGTSSNHLKEQNNIDNKAQWTITIDNTTGVATIKANISGNNKRDWMRYNTSGLFSCYGSGQTDIVLYAKAFDYERAIPQGQLSTTCLPNGGVIHGASIFEIAYMDYNGATPNKIYFYEVESGIMEAGMPYVVLANEGAAKFGVYYTDNANSAAQSKNGLVGYMGAQRALVENDYFIYDNKFYYVEAADAASGRIQIAPNRAYINLSQVPGYNHTPVSSHAPSSRVSLSNGAPQVSTGIDELNVSETPAKVIINGQLFILRGEKMFDATGRLVK